MLAFHMILAQHSRRSTSLAHTLAPLLHFPRRDENLVTEPPFSRPLFSSTSALFHFPYPVTHLFVTLTKTAGCIPTIPNLELVARQASLGTLFKFFLFIFLRTLLHVPKPQPFSFQILPHSLRKNTRVGGTPLPPQESQIPSGPATQRENVQRSAAEQTIEAGRNPFTEVGDPEGGDDSGKYVHG